MASAGFVGYQGFWRPRPYRPYAFKDLSQIGDSATRQIIETLDEAERRNLRFDRMGDVLSSADLKALNVLHARLTEATVMRDEIRREQLLRQWREPATGLLAVLAAGTLTLSVRRRRREAEGAASADAGLVFSPPAPDEAWARGLLGVGAFTNVDEVDAAFREQMARYHPDKVEHLGPDLRELANSRARDLVKARDVLRRALGLPSSRPPSQEQDPKRE